jgi:hypothetical protein
MKKNKINIKSFALNQINDYSKIQGGILTGVVNPTSPESKIKLIGSGINACGDTFQVSGHFFLGIHYGRDIVSSDPA